MSQNSVTYAGNLTKKPNSYTDPQTGNITAYFTIAYNGPARKDGSKPDAVYLDCSANGQLAQNILSTFTEGNESVIVTGKLVNIREDMVTTQGKQVTITKVRLNVWEAGASLLYATAQVHKNPRNDQTQGQQGFTHPYERGHQKAQGFQQAPAQPQAQGFQQAQPQPQAQGFQQAPAQGFNQGQQAQPQPQAQGFQQAPAQPQPQGQGFQQAPAQGFNQGQQAQGFNQGQGFGSAFTQQFGF